MDYEVIKKNYIRGLWSKPMVLLAVKKGVITQAQADEIFAAKDGGTATPEPSTGYQVTQAEATEAYQGGVNDVD